MGGGGEWGAGRGMGMGTGRRGVEGGYGGCEEEGGDMHGRVLATFLEGRGWAVWGYHVYILSPSSSSFLGVEERKVAGWGTLRVCRSFFASCGYGGMMEAGEGMGLHARFIGLAG